MSGTWARVRRVSIYDWNWHVRTPCLVRTAAGDVLLVFMRRSRRERADDRSELVAVRSADNGATWSDSVVVYAPDASADLRLHALAALSGGRLLGLVGTASGLMLLSGDDDGHSWRVADVSAETPLTSVTPSGSILEIDGQLVVPVYGPASAQGASGDDLQAGLMRSVDGGRTWGDYSAIAGSPEGLRCKDAAVVRKADGRLVAVFAGAHASSSLYRAWSVFQAASDDGGRTWTRALGILAGESPSLSVLPSGELACAQVVFGGEYAWLRFQTSDNDFRTWKDYQECWSIRYFRKKAFIGHPTMLPLDDDTLLVVFSRTRWTGIRRRGQVLSKLPLWVSSGEKSDGTSIDQERMEGVFFKRTRRQRPEPAPAAMADWRWVEDRQLFTGPVKGKCRGVVKTAGGDLWALEETRPDEYQLRTSHDEGATWAAAQPIQGKELVEKNESGHTPRPGLGTVTRSGRRLLVFPRTLTKRGGYTLRYVETDENGYGIWQARGEKWRTALHVFYSDDNGVTWIGGDKPIDASPLKHVVWPGGGILEDDDGTLVMNVWGDRTAEDVDRHIAGIVLLRSCDGGTSWGDPSVVAFGTPENGLRFNENSLAVLPDGTWIMLARVAFRHRIHQWPLALVRMTSRDRGRTWSEPERVFTGGAPSLAVLPGGGLVCAGSDGVYFSHDQGRSWIQKRTYANSKPIPLADGRLMLVGGHYHWNWVVARILEPVSR